MASRLVYYRDLVRELVLRDIRVRYKRSVLGFAWTLANPLLYLVVFYFVFKLALQINIPRFGAFAFTGLIVWNWFQSSLAQSGAAIVGNRELVRSPGFPADILPLVTVTSNLVNLLVALAVLIVYQVLAGTGISVQILYLPLLLALQFFLILCLAYIVAGVNVVFRDLGHLVVVLLQLMFFMTPIFYDAGMIPEEYRGLYGLNPMVHFVEAYRSVLLDVPGINWSALTVTGAVSLVVLVYGRRSFIRHSHRFAEEI
jgi:lipopolysaccharide transport system permease protein